MDIQDCIKFATENPICFMATTDGDQPRVRTLALEFVNENGFYIHKGEAFFFTLADTLREAELERIRF